jgi:formylglycine-generating enzyme required for sulfatase activity
MRILIFTLLALSLGSSLIYGGEGVLPPGFKDKHGIEFILLQPGVYSTPGLTSPESVEIRRAFYLSRTEITQAQWAAGMTTSTWKETQEFKEHGDVGEGNDLPVYFVSFEDTQRFIAKLNDEEEKPVYRLPTDEEWEFAARAGTNSVYSFGVESASLGESAWFAGNAEEVQPVGTKKPNTWGFHDMHGNVWEWVMDSTHDPFAMKVPPPAESEHSRKRGGSWRKDAAGCKITAAGVHNSTAREDDVGFRLVRIIMIPRIEQENGKKVQSEPPSEKK